MRLGCVVIGRNEGDRLKRCFESLLRSFSSIVYVDSASTDASVDLAISLNIAVVSLDMSQPFTAARARNVGFRRLIELDPAIQYVQFVDGDSTLNDTWVEHATEFLKAHDDVAAVAGHLQETHVDQSIYNWLCDIEWSGSSGEVTAVGGNAMMRVASFQKNNGFNESLIAGEEPELCHRLRLDGYRIFHLDHKMGNHDAAMTHFFQWWKRVSRGGFAFASVSWMHRNSKQKVWVRETLRPVFWGILLPLILFVGLIVGNATLVFLPMMLWILLCIKITARSLKQMPLVKALQYASFMLMAKFAEAVGVAKWAKERLFNQQSQLIEYK